MNFRLFLIAFISAPLGHNTHLKLFLAKTRIPKTHVNALATRRKQNTHVLPVANNSRAALI
jgi:hypothetical protein